MQIKQEENIFGKLGRHSCTEKDECLSNSSWITLNILNWEFFLLTFTFLKEHFRTI